MTLLVDVIQRDNLIDLTLEMKKLREYTLGFITLHQGFNFKYSLGA